MKHVVRTLFISISSFSCLTSLAFDDAHFYRANNLFFEPRLEKNYLSTFDIFVQGGSSSQGRNSCHSTVPLFDIYGTSDMTEISFGVPGKSMANPLDVIIKQLSLTPSRCYTTQDACENTYKFANFSVDGSFDIFELYLSYMQNFTHGFFGQIYFPIRRIKSGDATFNDISPRGAPCPNSQTPIWEVFKNNFGNILNRWNLSCETVTKTGIGDTSLALGWTYSYQKAEVLDFVDTTLRFGMLIPTGATADPDKIFSIPLGYNGHWGAIIDGTFAFGVYEWISLGAYFDVLVFGSKTQCRRLKTSLYQSGIIKLAKAEVSVESGPLWQVGGYVKADHFARGLSLIVGYSFASKNNDCLTPDDPEMFTPSIINSDEMLDGWQMSTVNLKAEYDFAREGKAIGPRIACYYNIPVAGKRYFMTSIGGGTLGLDVAWNF